MREDVKVTKVYRFEELSEAAQEKAMERLCTINVDYDWWESIYDDAETIGVKIKEFDLDLRFIQGDFILPASEVAQNISNNHGEHCETYKTADAFMKQWQPVFNDYMDEKSPKYESGESEEELQDIESEFLKSILEDYRVILRQEYDYLVSEEVIRETIDGNEYEFTEDGKLY